MLAEHGAPDIPPTTPSRIESTTTLSSTNAMLGEAPSHVGNHRESIGGRPAVLTSTCPYRDRIRLIKDFMTIGCAIVLGTVPLLKKIITGAVLCTRLMIGPCDRVPTKCRILSFRRRLRLVIHSRVYHRRSILPAQVARNEQAIPNRCCCAAPGKLMCGLWCFSRT